MGQGALVIFSGFRRFLEAIKALTSSLEMIEIALQKQNHIYAELGPALERLNTLERTRHQFEAECEGKLLKADGKLKAAASAEARERQLKKANERLADPFPENGDDEAAAAAVLPNHVAPGETEGLRPVSLVLATNDKTHAVRAKFGLT